MRSRYAALVLAACCCCHCYFLLVLGFLVSVVAESVCVESARKRRRRSAYPTFRIASRFLGEPTHECRIRIGFAFNFGVVEHRRYTGAFALPQCEFVCLFDFFFFTFFPSIHHTWWCHQVTGGCGGMCVCEIFWLNFRHSHFEFSSVEKYYLNDRITLERVPLYTLYI